MGVVGSVCVWYVYLESVCTACSLRVVCVYGCSALVCIVCVPG